MNKDSKSHKVVISGPDLNYEVEVDDIVAAQVYQGLKKISLDRSTRPFDQNSTLVSNLSNPLDISMNMSVREYLIEVNAKTNPQKILAFAKYLISKGNEFADIQELKLQFQNAQEPIPVHFARDFAIAVKKAWVAYSSDKSKCYVTNTGQRMIDSKFSELDKVKSKKPRKVGNSTFTEVKINDKVQNQSIDIELLGSPNYLEMNTLGDKILWILAKMKSLDVLRLNQKEIEYLSHKLGDNIPRKSITAVLETHKKNGRLYTPETNGVKYIEILRQGEEYVKNLNLSKG